MQRQITSAINPLGIPYSRFLGHLQQVEHDANEDPSCLRFVRDGADTWHEHRGQLTEDEVQALVILELDWNQSTGQTHLLDLSVIRTPPRLADNNSSQGTVGKGGIS
jgi:hypothetical protein